MKFIVDTNKDEKQMNEAKRNLRKEYIKFLKSVKNPQKNSWNPFTKSQYADLSSVLEVIKKAQNDTDLAFTQDVSTDDNNRIVCTSMLLGVDGSIVSEKLAMPVAKSDPQSYASIETYARRYSAQSFANIVAESDTDGNQYQNNNSNTNNSHRSNNQNTQSRSKPKQSQTNSNLATNSQIKVMQSLAKKVSENDGATDYNASQVGRVAMKDAKVKDATHMTHDEANRVINQLTNHLNNLNGEKD